MWTPCALASEARRYDADVIRMVEAQHVISTRRLADGLEDQALLEALAEEVKPPIPKEAAHLPWLLASPFRYGHKSPSRFRAANTRPGIFYASEEIETAVAETAYWRLYAFSRSPGMAAPTTAMQMSAYSVRAVTENAIDLTQPPLSRDHAAWTAPDDYTATQALGAAARQADLELIRAPSARAKGGINTAILSPAPLRPPHKSHSSWAFLIERGTLFAAQELGGTTMNFSAEGFGL